MYINTTIIPSDYVRRFQMDWGWKSDTWSWDGTFTNATFQLSTFWYVSENVLWGAITSFTYPSVTFTNSYLFKDWVMVKNSSEVTATALNWVNGSVYWLLTFFNRTLTTEEEKELNEEWLRIKGLSNAPLSGSFPKYSLPNLEEGKVLEISRPQSGGSYIDQTGNGNDWTPTSVTDSTNGLYNVMGFNGSSSYVSTSFSPSNLQNWFTAWLYLRPNDIISTQIVFQQFSWSWAFWDFLINAWSFTLRTFQTSDWSISAPIEVWKLQQFIFTIDWTILSLYKDWILIWTTVTNLQNPTGTVTVWRNNFWGGGNYYDWDALFVPIYDRALSDREMKELFYSSKLI